MKLTVEGETDCKSVKSLITVICGELYDGKVSILEGQGSFLEELTVKLRSEE